MNKMLAYIGNGLAVFLAFMGAALFLATCAGACRGDLPALIHGPGPVYDCPTTCADGSAPYWEDGHDPAQ